MSDEAIPDSMNDSWLEFLKYKFKPKTIKTYNDKKA